jgi:hypothetical protein
LKKASCALDLYGMFSLQIPEYKFSNDGLIIMFGGKLFIPSFSTVEGAYPRLVPVSFYKPLDAIYLIRCHYGRAPLTS